MLDEPTLDEGELVRRAQAGDRAAVDALLFRHLPGLEAYVRLRVGRAFGGREGVSDIVQSTCRDLLERMDGFRHGGEHAFRHWLYATAARKVADRFAFHGAERRDRRREALGEDASRALAVAFAGLASPSQAAMGAEFLTRLEQAFAELEEDEREVVLLSRVAGLSRADVARELGRSENGVRNLLHRTLVKLAERLDVAG
ncbi:RNA polymerase sigma factor [Engelhardtia mirabilis]|uniref:RNA polymerase sigma factor n=1 Tax=Engelhardtia mirabilis TaxID=2528011 RepID=UPI003AF341EE